VRGANGGSMIGGLIMLCTVAEWVVQAALRLWPLVCAGRLEHAGRSSCSALQPGACFSDGLATHVTTCIEDRYTTEFKLAVGRCRSPLAAPTIHRL
jgi:hypothetical protein